MAVLNYQMQVRAAETLLIQRVAMKAKVVDKIQKTYLHIVFLVVGGILAVQRYF